MKKTWLDENIKPILALIVVICAYAYFFAILILTGKVDPQVIIAIVALGSSATGYYFGSTSGQSKKDEVLSNMASNQQSSTVNTAGTVNIDKK